VLVWSRPARWALWCAFGALVAVFYGLPLAVIALASVAGEWNGIFPSKLGLLHYRMALSGDLRDQIRASLLTGLGASAAALLAGSWAALALRAHTEAVRKWLSLAFFIPSAVPSVSVGLGLLVAFSQPPLLLNGTTLIVLVAHFVLVFAFTFGNVSAGLHGLMPEFELVARSLGATPGYCLRRITLPLIAPQLATAFSLSFALSMGELGATVMIYPPGWMTMPVGIFSLSDRGEVFDGSALSILLILITLVALLVVARLAEQGHDRR